MSDSASDAASRPWQAQSRPALEQDDLERTVLAVLARMTRRRVEPTLDSELAVDLGFDSIQTLELVAELEEAFDIYVPLNAVFDIRRVRDVVEEVRRLTASQARA
jgi:acyl carrier protein